MQKHELGIVGGGWVLGHTKHMHQPLWLHPLALAAKTALEAPGIKAEGEVHKFLLMLFSIIGAFIVYMFFCCGVLVALSPSPSSCSGHDCFLCFLAMVAHSGVRSTRRLLPNQKTPYIFSHQNLVYTYDIDSLQIISGMIQLLLYIYIYIPLFDPKIQPISPAGASENCRGSCTPNRAGKSSRDET